MVSGNGRFDRPCVGMVAAAPAALLGRVRARLLGSASSLMLPASMALALGVTLSPQAHAQTIIGNQTTTYNLDPANNPFLINSGTTLTSGTDAIDGNNSVQWTLTNHGTVPETSSASICVRGAR
jgi:hypothetical protein